MKRLLAICTVLAILPILSGCSGKSEEDNAPPKVTAQINNNAPEAATAPAAPGVGPGVPSPGGGGFRKGGKR